MNSWKEIIECETKKDYFINIIKFVQEDAKNYIIYPKHSDIFNAFKYCSYVNTKVVIVGMDPYHGPNQAHGLSFSVLPGFAPPPSLVNIFKEIKNDLNIEQPSHGCLIPWARQGVLLLNSFLTVRQGQAGSHRNIGWEQFTDTIISSANLIDRPIVFMLWGAFARSKKALITSPHHLILESVHPSPLSAYNGFFGCKHFSKTNEFLIKQNIDPINWLL